MSSLLRKGISEAITNRSIFDFKKLIPLMYSDGNFSELVSYYEKKTSNLKTMGAINQKGTFT